MSEDNVSAKRALRAEMKARRAAEPCRAEKDFALAQNFFSLPAVREAWIFFLYRSFSSEAGTSLIAERLLSAITGTSPQAMASMAAIASISTVAECT